MKPFPVRSAQLRLEAPEVRKRQARERSFRRVRRPHNMNDNILYHALAD